MEVLINNQKAGTVGIKESLRTSVNKGQNTLTVRYTGLASFNTPGTLTFESNGATPNFFVVSQKQSLMGAKIQVSKTTAGSFANLLE